MQPQSTKRSNKLNLHQLSAKHSLNHTINQERYSTHTLLKLLHILTAHTNPPRPPQMPRRLPRQILNHDARKHGDFRLDVVEDRVIGEVQAVGDCSTCPVCWRLALSPTLRVWSLTKVLLSLEHLIDRPLIMLIQSALPRPSPLPILLVFLPSLSAQTISTRSLSSPAPCRQSRRHKCPPTPWHTYLENE